MTSLTGCLNLHLLFINSEKKNKTPQKKLSSCEHEPMILMSQGGYLMQPSLCLLQTESLCLMCKNSSLLLNAAGSSGAQLNSGDRIPVLPLKIWAALTGN